MMVLIAAAGAKQKKQPKVYIRNKEARNAKFFHKYHNDPEYRAHRLKITLASYYKRKAEIKMAGDLK